MNIYPVMNIYASDEYYMPVMNIIYACDVLEKRKKEKILR
jgi:hypothetical protein